MSVVKFGYEVSVARFKAASLLYRADGVKTRQ